jgi:hypothetical protein
MIKTLTIVSLCLTLGACASASDRIADTRALCEQMGFTGDAVANCVFQEEGQRKANNTALAYAILRSRGGI